MQKAVRLQIQNKMTKNHLDELLIEEAESDLLELGLAPAKIECPT